MTRFRTPRAGIVLTVAALVALCAVAVAPLLAGPMIETADGTIHLYRLPVLDHAFDDGSLWPRYPVATVYGYGSPLFNHYSALSLYPMHLLHVLGVSYLDAWLLGMALYVIVAAGGAYLLGRTWGGGTVGVVAAAAYVYAPYLIYDVLWRGTTSETAALALLPWVLWAVKTQSDHPSRRTFLAVILSLALFIPMHNVTTVHGGALIGLYSLYVVLTARDRRLAFVRVFGALALGALLATFYWYPAIRETPNIKIDAVTAALPDIDVTRNLASAWTAFRLPYPADPSLQQPPVAVALGWPQLVLAVLGILSLRAHTPRVRALLLLAVCGVAFLVFMLTPASAPVWRAVPLIGYSQYPSRLLGPASLLLAVLAGFGVDRLAARAMRLNGKLLAVGLPVVVVVLYTLPMGVRAPLPDHDPQNVVDALDFERESGFVGSSSFGEYVPIWTETLPDPTALRESFEANTFIPRLRPPNGVAITEADWRHTSGTFTIQADTESVLTLDWLYLPYFQATVDGLLVDVGPSVPDGRVQLTVPAGASTVSVWLAPSRTQAISAVVSATALAATLGILGLWPLLRGKPAVAYVARFEVVRDTRRALIAALLAGVVAIGAKAVYDRVPNPLRQERFAAGYAAGVHTVADANFGREVTLIGFDPPAAQIPAGAAAEFTLYWSPRIADIERDYIAVFTVRTRDGLEVSRTDDDRPGGIETHHWRHGQYLRQQIAVDVPPGTPPGTYRVAVQLYDRDADRALDVIGPEDAPVGVEMSLGEIMVARGERLQHARMRDISRRADGTPLAGQLDIIQMMGVRVMGLEGMPEQVTAGDTITFDGYWMLEERIPDASFALEWHVNGNELVGTSPLDLNTPLPLAQWQIGDAWRLGHRAIVPPRAEGPTHLYVRSADGSIYHVGQTMVVAPERTFELPAGVTVVDIPWNTGIWLAGYVEGNASIALYWTTDEEVTADLRRFAHIVGSDGELLDVVDGIPADWTRPVTGWLPGEYVEDRVQLNVLSGQSLRLGFYDVRTNERVPTASDDKFADVITR